ncbi:error-prone DNA polymerase [Agaribacterium haliotis]|uniref:error-prone DNA polymerase n=1 Tax=Agaribacterium haliotis TaxID=2013869 RepID=UPI000BB54FD5|nr:error-prone DNA polymerase [Agaribacterium haliotis]
MMLSALYCQSNFSFLCGASHPQELVERAVELGYRSLALTDECSLAGIVRAHQAAKCNNIRLICGSLIRLQSGEAFIVLAPDRQAYAELSGFITLARRRSNKGEYQANFEDLRFRLKRCFLIWLAESRLLERDKDSKAMFAQSLAKAFARRLWIGIDHRLLKAEVSAFLSWRQLAETVSIPLLACPKVLMHTKARKALQDVLTALKQRKSVQQMGSALEQNAQAYLKSPEQLSRLYPEELLLEAQILADRCHFSLDELKYQYPRELVPGGQTPIDYLSALVEQGSKQRWPQGVPYKVKQLISKELALIAELHYEYYFLTVYDIVRFARSQNILCQGRGSAANSVVCYCLRITEISPDMIHVLFERFISKERDEAPDIDVDFEHSRREEVIQYIYRKYGRERAALAATVICYRPRSAIRDVGRALGFEPGLIDSLAKSLAWWDRKGDLKRRIAEAGVQNSTRLSALFYQLVQAIQGFPRHLSQHVGGFVITEQALSSIVPVENAGMAERTVIQWDKDDLEAMQLMKVDVLALGMLTALRKCLEMVGSYQRQIQCLEDIPKEDAATYEMLSRADSIGVFQVESRAQMSMLPRLKPRCFYDLVIQIAIIRPGPIQGGMVHPYLKRRDGEEAIDYINDALKEVLEPTLGVPIFQEQAIRLSMVAAGFSGGEADELRRAMASWGKNGNLLQFEQKFIAGMLSNAYSKEFAHRLFEQIKGFGGYGFPESHSASFAILCYFSSWFKRHHPAAFYCALLNSQPMGFYSPSQLVQDARRHAIKVLPADVCFSSDECCLENIAASGENKLWALRLGLLQIKALNKAAAQRISSANKIKTFVSVHDLQLRAKLSRIELEYLASADALHSLQGHRYQSHWSVAGMQPSIMGCQVAEHALQSKSPEMIEDIQADFDSLRLSLRAHPMALLRRMAAFSSCRLQSELKFIRHGSFVQVAGIVTGRQRPGTAKGTVFLTLEDESGNINVVVWKRTQELFRQTLLNAKLIRVKGRLERKADVVHVIAGQLIDASEHIAALSTKSRDFH